MRTIIVLAVVILILIAGGALTTLIDSGTGPEVIPGAKVQTADVEASVFDAAPWQAGQFFLLVGFILFNMVGIGATLAVIFWFLNRGVARAKAAPSRSELAEGGGDPSS